MSIGGNTPRGAPVDLGKQQARPGPAWIVIPARVVALIVVVPLRLLFELVLLAGRGVRAVWNGLMWVFGWIGRALYRWLLAPFGRLLRAIIRGVGQVLFHLVVRPMWWVVRTLVVPVLRVVGWVLARFGGLFDLLFRGLGFLLRYLVVEPLVLLWRYVLRWPVHALFWVVRGTWAVVVALGRAVVWAWLLIGRCLAWLARVLILLPLWAVGRYVLAPIGAGIAWAWHLMTRVLGWLWNVLVVVPVRWAWTTTLRPVWHGARAAWRICVRDPLRAARRTVRDAARDVRQTLRRTFRGY